MEDWKKKYEELFGHVQDFHKRFSDQCSIKKEIEDCIPELAESEDERIRKEIIDYLDFAESHNLLRLAEYEKKKGWLTYLEKQKEQKPKNILTDDDSLQTAYLKGQTDVLEDPEAYGLQSLQPQPKQEWSEEDEKMLVGIIERGSAQIPPHEPALREEQMKWLMKRLKSLRPHPHWKPSEEQMKAVLTAQSVGSYGHRKALAELYNDLKKL